jgi:hypothetical protein
MFQYFDEELIRKHRRYRKLEREKRLRAATIIFVEMGLARLAEAQPLPMLVPTKDLMDLLGTSRLTTLVEPFLVPARTDCDQNESDRYHEYAMDLTRCLEDDLPGYVVQARPAMGAWALGRAEHRREDGRLSWSITRLGIESIGSGTIH